MIRKNIKQLKSKNLIKLNGNIYSRFPYKNINKVEIIFVKTFEIQGNKMIVGKFNNSCTKRKNNVNCWTFVTKSSEMKRIFKTLSDLNEPKLIQKRLKEILGLHPDFGTYTFVYVGTVKGSDMISPLNYLGQGNNNNHVSKQTVHNLVKSSWNKTINLTNGPNHVTRLKKIKFTGKGYTFNEGAQKYTKNNYNTNLTKTKKPIYFGVKEYVLKPDTEIFDLRRHNLYEYIKQMKENKDIKPLPGYIKKYV